jgi:hypothetical protein
MAICRVPMIVDRWTQRAPEDEGKIKPISSGTAVSYLMRSGLSKGIGEQAAQTRG